MTHLYTRLCSSVLFPLQEALKGHDTVAVRRALEASQWWSPERIAALQLDRLRRLLERAGREVPYYRQLFSALGCTATNCTRLEDLRRLPLLDKAAIRAQREAMKSERARRLVRFTTGGSSGEPLVFYLGVERVAHDVAAKWRATRWWGVDIGDPEIVLWGSPIELGSQDRLRSLRDRVFRTQLLPAFAMSETRLDGFLDVIVRSRPRMLFGYPSALAHVARHARLRGRALDQLGVRVAFVTSERLYDEQRALISSTFGCPVANGYGGRDAGFIAHECPHGRLHITAEDVIVEIVDNAGLPLPAGAAGEIVVTHLATGDFPFIRYRTGDVGVLDAAPCPCGRGLPVLARIEGRTTDFVVAADGTVLHGLALIYVVRDLDAVRAFRIVQETLARTRVELVLDGPPAPALLEQIRAGIRTRLGSGVEVVIELRDEIPRERSGKFRYIVSHVAAAHAGAAPGADVADR